MKKTAQSPVVLELKVQRGGGVAEHLAFINQIIIPDWDKYRGS
jgi:hypothetical protein